MLCHAGANKNTLRAVKRMNHGEPGQENSSADTTPAASNYHEEHCSYLLRLWRAGGDGGWRASLQSIPAGERHMFADLESLIAGHGEIPRCSAIRSGKLPSLSGVSTK